MNIRLLLLPLTLVYAAIMHLRNMLYDMGILSHDEFSRPVICVGNITVGGTGKTPFIEYLIKMLEDYRVSIVSRGYRRKTKGLVVATETSTAEEIGDEPCQMHEKFPHVPIAVAEQRKEAIRCVIDNHGAEVVLMDDGYQHRSVKASMNVLMTDYGRPMWDDWTFPAGNMREPYSGKKRADIIVVNKCPIDMSEEERKRYVSKLDVDVDVFFTAIGYGSIKSIDGKEVDVVLDDVIAVAGIGRPGPFFDEVARRSRKTENRAFQDHYQFTDKDVEQLIADSNNGQRIIITTEKDAKRLQNFGSIISQESKNIVYLPIELRVLFGEADKLNTKILDHVRGFDRKDK